MFQDLTGLGGEEASWCPGRGEMPEKTELFMDNHRKMKVLETWWEGMGRCRNI